MNDEFIKSLKQKMIEVGQLLWQKDLASGLNGNISARVDAETLLLTATGTCLGRLQEHDILLMKVSGDLLEEGRVSTEKLLHTEIYKNFPDIKTVVHTHTTYTNAYFLNKPKLEPKIFETRVFLGEVQGIEQNTPAVTNAGPVIEALQTNNITALRNHGVVAMGQEHFDCFVLIQALEDAVKVDAISRLYQANTQSVEVEADELEPASSAATASYKLFSQEQMTAITEYVNNDDEMKRLGEETNMTFDLAVLLDETGESYSFEFEKGHIARIRNDADAEFVVSAPEKVWRQVFNQEIDPFVATTQKKMNLQGDFAKISKWYAPCSRVFEIWAKVPVQ